MSHSPRSGARGPGGVCQDETCKRSNCNPPHGLAYTAVQSQPLDVARNMTLAHEYASREPNPEPKPQTQTPNPKPKPQTRTRTRTQTQTRSPNRSPNRPHRINSALGMGAEGSSAGGKGGMNPSKGEGSIPRCSLYPLPLHPLHSSTDPEYCFVNNQRILIVLPSSPSNARR